MRLQPFLAYVAGVLSVLASVATFTSAITLGIQADDYTAAQSVPRIGDKVSSRTFADETKNDAQILDVVNEPGDVADYNGEKDGGDKMTARDEIVSVGDLQPVDQADGASIHDPVLNLDDRQTQNDTIHATATSTVFVPSQLTDTPNPNDGQINDEDSWCCVVTAGVKFCFPVDCPSATSATSATEVSLLPPTPATATTTMTYGMRSLLAPQMDDETNEAEALCCFTTGFIVFGCYLCRSPTPTGVVINPPLALDVWELEGTSGDTQSRYAKTTKGIFGYSMDFVNGAEQVVCTVEDPDRLICR